MGRSRYKKHVTSCVLGLLCLFWGATLLASSQQEALDKLAQARENLRISEATEARIASQLARLKASGNAAPDVLADYETYLDRVRRMVQENRKILQDMEAALKRHEPRDAGAGTPEQREKGPGSGPQVPEEEIKDEVAALDKEFYASLATFDEMLLKELDEIRAKSAGRMRDLAQEAAAAAQRVRDKGVKVNTSSRQGSKEAGAQETDSGQEGAERAGGKESGTEGEEAEARGEQDRDRTASTAGGTSREYDRSPGDGKGGIPPSRERPSGYDDDIVARQIREAAEKETDPELKERLWKEYENYKRGNIQ